MGWSGRVTWCAMGLSLQLGRKSDGLTRLGTVVVGVMVMPGGG